MDYFVKNLSEGNGKIDQFILIIKLRAAGKVKNIFKTLKISVS